MSDQHDERFVLKVTVRQKESESQNKHKHIEIVRVIRSPRGEVEIRLSDNEEIESTGWIPQIISRPSDRKETLELVISPKLAPFLSRMTGEPEFNVLGTLKENYVCNAEPRDPPDDHDNENPKEDDVLYRVSFENGEIKMNESILSKPNFDAENEVVFSYLYQNPNRKIGVAEIETAIQRSIKKRLIHIVRTLGFAKELKTMFFPLVSKTAIIFINPITRSDFMKRGLRSPRMREK